VTGLVVRFVVIGAIVAGGILFRDRLTGGAQDLKVGDCFDDQAATVIKEVQHHPCNESHTAEVVLVTAYPAAKGAAYPTDAALENWAGDTCVPVIIGYVGPAADLATLDYGILYPKESDWTDGARKMVCYATQVDLAPMTKSLHAGS
jgi:hypothetical protein